MLKLYARKIRENCEWQQKNFWYYQFYLAWASFDNGSIRRDVLLRRTNASLGIHPLWNKSCVHNQKHTYLNSLDDCICSHTLVSDQYMAEPDTAHSLAQQYRMWIQKKKKIDSSNIPLYRDILHPGALLLLTYKSYTSFKIPATLLIGIERNALLFFIRSRKICR